MMQQKRSTTVALVCLVYCLAFSSFASAWKGPLELLHGGENKGEQPEPQQQTIMEEYVRSLQKKYQPDGTLDRELRRQPLQSLFSTPQQGSTVTRRKRAQANKTAQAKKKTNRAANKKTPAWKLKRQENKANEENELGSKNGGAGAGAGLDSKAAGAGADSKAAGASGSKSSGSSSKTAAPTMTVAPTCPPILFLPGSKRSNSSRGTSSKSAGVCYTAAPTQTCAPTVSPAPTPSPGKGKGKGSSSSKISSFSCPGKGKGKGKGSSRRVRF